MRFFLVILQSYFLKKQPSFQVNFESFVWKFQPLIRRFTLQLYVKLNSVHNELRFYKVTGYFGL